MKVFEKFSYCWQSVPLFVPNRPQSRQSERIADGEVECEAVLERGHVVIAAAAGLVRGMDANAEVGTKHEHVHVETQAETGAERNILKEILCRELRTGTQRVFLQQPHIAHVDKQRAVQETEYGEPIFGIQLDFKRTGLVVVAVGRTVGVVAAGTYRPHGESAHRVGTAYVKLFGVWHFGRVAVGMLRTDESPCHNRLSRAHAARVYQLRLRLHKL